MSGFALTLAISDGVLCYPPTILSQAALPEERFMALDVATLLSATKAGKLLECSKGLMVR